MTAPRTPLLALLTLLAASCANTRVAPSIPAARGAATAYSPTAYSPSAAAPRAVQSSGDRTLLGLMLGGRVMTNDDWDIDSGGIELDLSSQSVLGVEGATVPADGSVGTEWAFTVAAATDDDTVLGEDVDLDATTFEASFGFRKTFLADGAALAPYVGAGVAALTTIVEASGEDSNVTITEDDSAVGIYFHAGAHFFLGEGMSLGVDYRLLTGAEYLDELDGLDSDYSQLLFVLGLWN